MSVRLRRATRATIAKWVSTTLVAGGVCYPTAQARAADGDSLAAEAQNEMASVAAEAASVQASIDQAKRQRYTVEQRLTNGELLFRSKDYARATLIFSEIIEEFPNTPSYTDALWMRAESFYAEREYLSARRDYRQIVERGGEPRFSPYLGRSLARLVDVCLRIDDIKGLDEIFTKINQVPPAFVDAALQYAKGKAAYFRRDYSSASSAFRSVPNTSTYAHQARYFDGLVAMKTAAPAMPPPAPPGAPTPPVLRLPKVNYKPAIESFRGATELSPDSPEHRLMIDLSWLAIGRLHYEMENYRQAAEAYSKVGRESPEFGTMLYELAWVYVRLGDIQRAERALEVLQVSDPSSPHSADATLLRADLLLRAGSFEKALQLYTSIREEYDPMRVKVESFIAKTSDPAVYYDKLQQHPDVVDPKAELPSEVVRWAREAEDGAMAFAVMDDVNQCKTLLRQSYQLIDKLVMLIGAANRVRAFPELHAGEEKALSLLNRIAKMRLSIARGFDASMRVESSGPAAAVRAERRGLEPQMLQLPVDSAGFASRDYQSTRQWNLVSQELTRRGVELDYLNATINGLRRMLKEDAQRGVARDSAALKRINDELDETERQLKQKQEVVATLRRQIDIGRAQVGFGDGRYQSDAQARVLYRDALDREFELAARGEAGEEARRFALAVKRVLETARGLEDRLVEQFAQLEQQVATKLAEVERSIETERLKINGYNLQLGALEREAQGLVGEVAKRNFLHVRDKVRGIVLRADVGITEHAWEVREEELERVRNLQTERAREEQLLDEELREVLDDSGSPGNTGMTK